MKEEQEVDQYLSRLEPERDEALRALRALVGRVVPVAVESRDYRMPTYRFKGNPLCAFASRKQHMTLYIHTRLLAKYDDRLAGLSVGKECIRFKRLTDLPLDTVKQIIHEAARVERA